MNAQTEKQTERQTDTQNSVLYVGLAQACSNYVCSYLPSYTVYVAKA